MVVTLTLPGQFGLVFDSWTDMSTATLFTALYACYPSNETKNTSYILLGFSPVENEENLTSVNFIFFREALSIYHKSFEKVVFIVGVIVKTAKDIDK